MPNNSQSDKLNKGKFTHVRSRFSLVKAQREVLPRLTDRGLSTTIQKYDDVFLESNG